MKEEGGHTRKRGFPLSKQRKGSKRMRFKPHQPFLSPPSVFGHILTSQPRLLFFGFVSLIKSQSKAKRCLGCFWGTSLTFPRGQGSA